MTTEVVSTAMVPSRAAWRSLLWSAPLTALWRVGGYWWRVDWLSHRGASRARRRDSDVGSCSGARGDCGAVRLADGYK
jgi:hypothetical protein